jgi:pilin isopeptide linkage protein
VETQTDVTVNGKKLSGEEVKKSFSFAGVDWPKEPAVYRYIVSETAGSSGNITYDSTTYVVDVTVDNEGDVVYVAGWNSTTAADQRTSDTKTPIVFNNICSSDNLKITKTVKGSLGSKTTQFKFSILIPIGTDDNSNGKLSASDTFSGTFTRNTDSLAKDVKEITITAGTAAEFTLADNETLLISNLPEGTIYTVKEEVYSDYSTTIQGITKTANSTNGTSANTKDVEGVEFTNFPIVDGGNTVNYTNEKDVTPTGIALDVAPYLAVLLIAIVGVVVAFAGKKRRTAR